MDPETVLEILGHVSRDNARTPMQWTSEPGGGFTKGVPWIGLGPRYPEINVEQDQAAPKSIFRYYQQLIRLRHELPVVATGDFQLMHANHPTLFAFSRTLGETRLGVIGNFSGLEQAAPDDLQGGELILGNYGEKRQTAVFGPWEARVLDISGLS